MINTVNALNAAKTAETTNGKINVKTLSLECPGCTAQMLLDMEHHRAYCEYCGKVMLLDYDFSKTASPKEKEPETEEERELLRKKRLKAAMDAEDRAKAVERSRLGLDVWSTYSPPEKDNNSYDRFADGLSTFESLIDGISETFPPVIAFILIAAIFILILAAVLLFLILAISSYGM